MHLRPESCPRNHENRSDIYEDYSDLTAAAIAAALSLPFAGAALADTPAIDKTDTVMLAANTMDDAGDAASDTGSPPR